MHNPVNANPIRPYEGSEPYIFVSYSHKDREKVFPLLADLQMAGFRFWFDEGIDPGSEWPESVGTHLAGCSVCLIFISENSIHSNNVRREINFAVSRDLAFLSVFLEECSMSPGMELQLSTYQSLFKYKYNDDEQFVRVLSSIDLLSGCREARTERQPSSEPEEKCSDSAPFGNRIEDNPGKSKKRKWIIAAVSCAVAVILLLWFFLSDRGIEIDGKTFYKADISGVSITAEDMKKLRAFKNDTWLKFESCSFESGALSAIPLTEIGQLIITDCDGVDSLDVLSNFPELFLLRINDSGLKDGMLPSSIASDQLETLDLSCNELTEIPEIALADSVTTLDLSKNAISDFSDLSGQDSLISLSIAGNGIQDFSGISNLEHLQMLYAEDNELTGTNDLENMVYLKELDLRNNKISNWDGLENLTLLTILKIGGNPDSNGISAVMNCASTLTSIDVSGISIDEELQSLLESCVNATKLYADECGLTDENSEFLLNMPLLTELSISGNSLTNCTNLKSLGNLSCLNLSNNQLTELAGLPENSETEDGASITLLLHGNSLESLYGLPDSFYYNILTIYNNPLKDFNALYSLKGHIIMTDLYTGMDIEKLSTTLFSNYYFCNVPPKRKVELEKSVSPLHYFDSEDDSALWALIN